jgi:glycyl-tRNA synthetase
MDKLKYDLPCYYEEKDTIGKRYRRMDAIGTPFCITVDHQTLEDHTVTLRHRDSMGQDRIAFDKIPALVIEKTEMKSALKAL